MNGNFFDCDLDMNAIDGAAADDAEGGEVAVATADDIVVTVTVCICVWERERRTDSIAK